MIRHGNSKLEYFALSTDLGQPSILDPPRLNRLSSDEQLEVYRESNNDLNAVVDRLMQRTVENIPNAVPVDLAAPQLLFRRMQNERVTGGHSKG